MAAFSRSSASSRIAGEPERSVEVRIDQTQARALGLSSQDVAGAMAAVFSGVTVTTVRDQDRLIDVVARAALGDRTDLATLANLQIRGPEGRSVPLRQIADLRYGVQDPIVWRRQRLALITVQADIPEGVQPTTVVNALGPAVTEFGASLGIAAFVGDL